MSYDELILLQGHGTFVLTVVLTIGLYAYLYHLYKQQRSGARDYEKYSQIALDDELDAAPVERRAA